MLTLAAREVQLNHKDAATPDTPVPNLLLWVLHLATASFAGAAGAVRCAAFPAAELHVAER